MEEFLRRPHIFIDCLKRVTAPKQTMHNIVVATIEFSLNKLE